MKRLRTVYIVLFIFTLVIPNQLVSQSLNFDGDQDYVNVNTVADQVSGTTDWAVSFWARPTLGSFPENDSYLFSVNSSSGGNILMVGLKKTTGYPIVFEGYIEITGSTAATDGEWNHIVYSRSGYTGTIYLNGVSQGTHSADMSMYSNHRWTIGAEYDSETLTNEFVGQMDEVAVWNDDLTAAEVAALYNTGAPLSASTNAGDYTSSNDLKAYWLMNEGSGSTIADVTSNSNSGTITGATWSNATPVISAEANYQWTTSDSSGGPTYEWVDISSTGTTISMSGDDQNTGPHPIGFTFPYYDENYTTFRISTNGLISFSSSSASYSNIQIPSTSAPEAMLAPFWDDLNFNGQNRASYYSDGSQLVITYNAVPRYGQTSSTSMTFQVILKSSGEIIYQYNDLTGTITSTTIGWQNQDKDDGASIVYNGNPSGLPKEEWAIRIVNINAGVTPPTDFAVTSSYQTNTLGWTEAVSPGVSNYVLYRGSSASNLSAYDSVAANISSYTDDGLSNGTTYYYGIKSKTSSGDYSVFMPTANGTPSVAPPTSFSVTPGEGQVTLNWTAATGSGVARTVIYQGTSSSSLSRVDSTSSGSVTSKTITGLNNSTLYYFTVRSRGNDNSLSTAATTVSATPAYEGPVWWVATNGSSSNAGSVNSPFSTIQDAYNAAAAGDTIKLKPGTYTGAGNRNITIAKNIVITSRGGADSTSLDLQNNNYRHFTIGNTATLDTGVVFIGLTFKNSNYSYAGGSMYVYNSSPRFKNCVFENNRAYSSLGGAIHIQDFNDTHLTSPVFQNCTFKDNSAKNNGGAIYIEGYEGTPVFRGCTFTGNNSLSTYSQYTNNYGGAVYLLSRDTTFTASFADCVFDSNKAESGYYSGYGGAVYAQSYNEDTRPATFVRSYFRGNTAKGRQNGYGGALNMDMGFKLVNCSITGNTATTSSTSSYYYGRGGAIYMDNYHRYANTGSPPYYFGGDSKIINCTIAGNTASSTYSSSDWGGGIYANALASTEFTMFNTIIWGNTSDNYESIYRSSTNMTLTFDYNNIADYDYTLASNSTAIDPAFTNASNNDYSLSSSSYLLGAGAATYDGNAAPSNDIASSARPNPSGTSPDLGAHESSLSGSPNPGQVQGLSIAARDGGAVLSWTANTDSDMASYKIYKSTTSGFTPSSTTLLATVSHPAATYTATSLTNGTTYYFLLSAVDTDGNVGLYSTQVSVVPNYAGPVWWVATNGSSSNVGSSSSPFSTLSSAYSAAADGDTITFKDGTFTGSGNRNITFSSSKNVVINSLNGAASSILDAGAASRHFTFNSGVDSTFEVIGLTLKNGNNYQGGSIYINSASPKFKNCTIRDNTASTSATVYGGAIYITGTSSYPTFSNCQIVSNTAEPTGSESNSALGGAIYVLSGSPVFTDCQINYNTNSARYYGNGGAVYLAQSDHRNTDPVTFRRCQFIGNSNTSTYNGFVYGGGLSIQREAVLSGCLIAGNTGSSAARHAYGGGIHIDLPFFGSEVGEVLIVNSTIAGNSIFAPSSYTSYGGGINIAANEDVIMFNSIVWDNTAESSDNMLVSGSSLTSDYNDIEGGTGQSWFGNNSLNIDPRFTDASAGNYNLSLYSTLLGAGTANFDSKSAPTTDISGTVRPNPSNSTIDIGAYESTLGTSPVPAAPTGLAVTAGNGQVVLTWTAHTDTDVSKYGIYYGTSSGPTVKQADVSGRTTVTTTVTNLSNNVAYFFRITAIDSDNYESAYSTEVSVTPAFDGTTIYVDNSPSTAPANPTGEEDNAYYTIQAALENSNTTNGMQILVKAGTYTGHGDHPVVEFNGKNVVIESVAGPATTIIDGQGSRTAISMNYNDGGYGSGYTNSTKIIGFTIKNGDEEYPLVDIEGPSYSSSSSNRVPWNPVFENCRFMNSTVAHSVSSWQQDRTVITIYRASPTFDGCTFRGLKRTNDGGSTSSGVNFYAPIRMKGNEGMIWNNSGQFYAPYDSVVYRPKFKNCVIAGNSNELDSETTNTGFAFYGGAVSIGTNAAAYFENTRIDSNKIEAGGDYQGTAPDLYTGSSNQSSSYGGAVHIHQGPKNNPAVLFVNSSISYNTNNGTNIYGGAVYTRFGQTWFINSVLVQNEANSKYKNSASSNSNTYNNAYGGAVYYDLWNSFGDNSNYTSKDAEIRIVSSTIADNEVNPTSNNSSYAGAGLYRYSSSYDAVIFNSIIYGNTTATGTVTPSKINMSTSNGTWGTTDSEVDYSLIQYASEAGVDEDNVLSTDPKFSAGATVYTLSAASPAIGAGTSTFESITTPAYDYLNTARPVPTGSSPDLGAFENSLSTTPYPDSPAGLTVSSVNDGTVTLSWTAGTETDLVRYRIYEGTSADAATLVDSVGASFTLKSVGGLTNGTTYYFAIVVVDGDGYVSGQSNVVSGTPEYKGPVWYVDDDATNSNGDGSPALPFREIEDGIEAASTGDTVMVLPGTYDRAGDQDLSFIIYNNTQNSYTVKNIVLKSRDGAATTILDGESSRVFNLQAYNYNNQTIYNNDTTLQIIGFTIKGSNGGDEQNSNGSLIRVYGSTTNQWVSDQWVYTNHYQGVTFKNCIIADTDTDRGTNSVNGIVFLGYADARFIDCIIRDNTLTANSASGTIRVDQKSNVILNRCKIVRNTVISEEGSAYGGAISATNADHTVKIINCIIAENKARSEYIWGDVNGGGILFGGYGHLTLINSTITGNIAENTNYPSGTSYVYAGGIGLYNNYTDPMHITAFNNIIYGNVGGSNFSSNYGSANVYISTTNTEYVVSHSILGGVDEDEFDFGDGILDINPQFADTNYTLSSASTAIGTGTASIEDSDNNNVYAPTVDYSGNVRPNPVGSNPDMGAQENSLAVTPYPDAPTNIAGTAAHRSVSLTWSAPSADDVTKYYVFQADSSSNGWSSFASADTLTGLTSTSTTITGLTNSTKYAFYVTAIDTANYQSSASGQVKLTPFYNGPVWYVDDGSGAGSHEGSPDDPFREVQDAIDVASSGDTVLVLPGTYDRGDDKELEFRNSDDTAKNIVLMSRDGAATTFLDGKNKRVFEIVNGTDTTLYIIGFTITASTGGEDDGSGAVVKINGNSFWNNATQQNESVSSGATFKHCVFTMSDSDEDWSEVAVDIDQSNVVFDNCEFKNISVDYTNYQYGDAFAAAIRAGSPYGNGSQSGSTVILRRSKITNNKIQRTDVGYIHAGAIMMGPSSFNNVKLINTIIADNEVYYAHVSSSGPQYPSGGGAIKVRGGHLQLINSTIVNNELKTDENYTGGGSAINVEDWTTDGYQPYFTMLNSIIYGNVTTTSGGSNFQDQIMINDYSDGYEAYFSYSVIQGDDDFGGDEILHAEPSFLDSTYALHPRSAAIGAGFSEGEDAFGNIINAPQIDYAGNVRPNPAGSDPDIGAWENSLAVSPYPDPPTGLFATEDNQSVLLLWSAPDARDVVQYRIYFSSDSTTFTLVDSTAGLYSTEGTVTGLTNDQRYWFYVTGVDTAGYESSPSLQVVAEPRYLGPVWYVDANSSSGSHEGSAGDAFREIQDAIDAADEGDTVMVLPGTYERSDDQELQFAVENQTNGTITPKNIVLFARDGPDNTIIDGEGNKQLFIIDTQNDTTLKIVGFTIQNGGGDLYEGAAITVSGVYVTTTNGTPVFNPSGAVFENCVIKDADSEQSPAILVTDGGAAIFRDCLIKNNRNYTTGGQVDGAGIKVHQQGIVMLDRTKVMENYTDNTGPGSENHRGPGVHADNSTIYVINSLIAGNYSIEDHQNSANYGSGLYAWNSEVVIMNSTITDNQGIVNQPSGSGTAVDIGGDNIRQIVIFNSIITGNYPSNMQTFVGQNSGQYVAISNSIFEAGSSEWFFDDSEGCYDFDPMFTDSLGTLSAYSPAIGKGGTSFEDADGDDIPSPTIDLYGNPRPNPAGSSPDIGAYEHVLSEPRRLVYYVDDSNGNNNNDGLTIATALKTIAEGLNKSSNRDTLELAAGTYAGTNNRNLDMQGLTRIIRSASGPATTIIDCENQDRAFVFNSNENDSVHISGLTIINGYGGDGGAIHIWGADPIFENIIFRDNEGFASGGAVYLNDSQSRFINCVFDGNIGNSPALHISSGAVSVDHCTFINNTSTQDSHNGIGINNAGVFEMTNSIYWGNNDIDDSATVAFSNVMGGFDGAGNINGRPGFTDAQNGDLTLLSWSPMIGGARPFNAVESDIAGVARPDTANPDMGAYENSLHAPSTYTSVTWHVNTAGTDEVIYSNPSASTGAFESIDWVMDHVLEGDSVIIHPGHYDHGFSNWGKSAHLRGSSSKPDDVWISEEMEFSGGSNSLHMLSIHNDAGSGINVTGGSIDISYVLIDSVSGEAIALRDTADASISNVTLFGNGKALVDSSSGTVTVVNSIIWGNTIAVSGDPSITYSNVQGGYTGTGNVNVDPLFTNAAEKDFELSILSPCIDTGDTSSTYDADNTVVDMGAFPRQRVLLSGSSTGDINVSADTVVIITDDFTVAEDDTLELDAGAELYFGPGVSLTVSGSLSADGNSDGGAISFLPTHPDSTWGGLTISGESGDGHGHGGRSSHNIYSYIQISGVEAASIPLTVEGSATLNHVTIAGNANAVSLSTTGTIDLNYSILEGQVEGTLNSLGSFTSSTDQFTDYANDDFTLLAAAAAIDNDLSTVDEDYTYGDAGAYYHDQRSYPVTSITILHPAAGDTVLASPDTSATVGLASNVQLFNTYGRYKTNGSVAWTSVNNAGSFYIVSTDSTNLNGIVSNQYVTSAVTGSYNSFTASADDAASTSGFYLIEPGAPDSVVIAVQSASMTQLDSLTFTSNIYDQFSNSVRLGENVVWSINSISGSGDGYRLGSDTTVTDASGNTAVVLYTDPTDNALSVGDQVTVTATSGSGSHVSSVVTIIPSDIYNLTLNDNLTSEEIGVSADTAYIDFYTALIDTFDNPLENVEVFWEVVTGSGTGESLSAETSNTNAQGVAITRLNTNTVADTEYQIRCWVTESSLLSAFGSFEALANNTSNNAFSSTSSALNLSSTRSFSSTGKRGVSDRSTLFARDEESHLRASQFVPVQIRESSTIGRNVNRVAAYDLDDTSAVVLVWPGVTHHLNNVPQNAEDLELDEQFGFTLDALDQFGNLVRDNTSVTWEISPPSASVSIVSQDDVTTNGQAAIALEVAGNAVWDFSFKVIATVEGVNDTTGSYRIDDVTAPASVSALSIDPSVWTSNNDFTLSWTNPSEHSGVAGAHYKINGESSQYVAGPNIQTLNFTIPANDSRTVKLWLQDEAGNEDESNAMIVTAKWDDTAPQAFDLTQPLAGWYNQTEYRFEWGTSSDVTSGLSHYLFSLNGGNETAEISPDSTGFSPAFGLAQGSHSWTVTAYDSAGNTIETSNPQTINVDHTPPGITHNPVQEATENTAVVINAVFTEDGSGQSGINKAELYYRRGGEASWQPPVDMSTLSSYQIASAYSTSSGIEYYLYAEDVAGNITNKPVEGFTSISVTIPNGLASTDRWPTGVPNGADVSSYQLWSFPGNPSSASPVNLIVDDMPGAAFDNTMWRAFAYAGSGAWTEFEQLSSLNSGESYFILIKDPGFTINTGQTYTIETNQPYQINLTSGDWTFIGNPFDFSIPLSSVLTQDSTSLSGDPNFYTYDGGSWTSASSIEPWGGYIYKSSSASSIFINPGNGSGGLLGRSIADSEIILEDNEWLINISARNGLGRDQFNEVGLLQGAMDTYDNHDAFEPPLVPGGISVRVNNRDWPENGDTYTRDIRTPKEDGEYWDLEVIAQDDEHNVYLTFEDLDLIPEKLDVFAIDITLGIAQDLRWRHVYKYAVTDPSQKHEVRFIAGTRDFLQKNNAGVELFPDRYALSQNYPNPFNPQTSILLTMQDEATISLVVYNLLGEEVAVLANNEYRPAGYHNFIWKGLNKDNQRVASGVYFYMARVISPKGKLLISDTHKMLLVK